MVVRRLKDRLRAKFNVAVSELDHQELWQRASIGVVTIGPEQAFLDQVIRAAADEAERVLPECQIQSSVEFF